MRPFFPPGGIGIAISATGVTILVAQEVELVTAARFWIFSGMKGIEQLIK